MKPAIATLLTLLLCCAGSAQAPPTVIDYYPLKIGTRWTYAAIDMKAAQPKIDPKRTITVEVEKEESYTRKAVDDKTGTPIAKDFAGYLLKGVSGDKTTRDQVVVMDNGVYQVHTAGTQLTPPLPIFKLLTKWDAQSTSGSTTIKGTCTLKIETIKVPQGEHVTYRISYRSDPSVTPAVEIDRWYAKGIGMVKQHTKTKGHETMLELVKFEEPK